MSTKIDIHVLELLASKICHDLISPVGAVANGVEFLEELEIEGADDIVELIQFSARQGSAKLQAYRLAYGAGGADTSIKPEDVHKMFGAFIALDKKIEQDWDPYGPLGPEERAPGFCKLLMCGLLLGVESLPKGGVLRVMAGGANETLIRAEGTDCAIKPDCRKALTSVMAAEALTPKQMHAQTTLLLCQHYGFQIAVQEDGDGFVVYALTSPAVAA